MRMTARTAPRRRRRADKCEGRSSRLQPVIRMKLHLRRFDLDIAVDHGELRRLALERLPGLRVAVEIRGNDFVAQRSAWIRARDDPNCGPEMVDRRTGRRRRMRTEFRVERLAVRQLDNKTLDTLVVERLAGAVANANTPSHLFQML